MYLGEAVGVDEVEQGPEDGRAHVLNDHHAFFSLAHVPAQQRVEDGGARAQHDAVGLHGLVLHLEGHVRVAAALQQQRQVVAQRRRRHLHGVNEELVILHDECNSELHLFQPMPG